MSVVDILHDFKSVKLPKDKRRFVNESLDTLSSVGSLPVATKDRLREMARHYHRQLTELHASRERARRTNWRMRNRITQEQETSLVDARAERIAEQRRDLGI